MFTHNIMDAGILGGGWDSTAAEQRHQVGRKCIFIASASEDAALAKSGFRWRLQALLCYTDKWAKGDTEMLREVEDLTHHLMDCMSNINIHINSIQKILN